MTSLERSSDISFHSSRFSVGYIVTILRGPLEVHPSRTLYLIVDLIAGLTVGIVVVRQSMSYAKVATLPVQYGLYSSFVGVFLYCFFATSKDVTIGPVAVMSLQTAHVIAAVQAAHPKQWTAELIATILVK
jgi:MFS superfamily sulfate permease-like transporter